MKIHELLVEAPSSDEIDVFFAALHRKFKDEEIDEFVTPTNVRVFRLYFTIHFIGEMEVRVFAGSTGDKKWAVAGYLRKSTWALRLPTKTQLDVEQLRTFSKPSEVIKFIEYVRQICK